MLEHPGVENYRRLRTANKTFQQRVWRHLAAQEFMAALGWIEVGRLLTGRVTLLFVDALFVVRVLSLLRLKEM